MLDFLEDMFSWEANDLAHQAALQLAVVFIVAMVIARVASKLKYLPKVTAYLLVGLVLSDNVLQFLDAEAVKSMEVLKDIALSLILFLVGTEFRMSSLAGGIRRALRVSAWDVGLTFGLTALVCTGVALVTNPENAIVIGMLLGAFALEIGPASTLAVLREQNSHGPYTDYLKLLVANANTAALIVFAVVAAFLLPSGDSGIERSLAESAWWLLVPLPLGIFLGVFLAWVESFEKKETLRMLTMLAVLMGAIGLSQSLGASQLLTTIVAGFAYANASMKGRPVLDATRVLETPFYVIFFVYSGASLHLEELPHIGLLGIAYVVVRTLSHYLGTWMGAKRAGKSRELRGLLGASVLSHSAIVLALLAVVKQRVGGDADLYNTLQTLVLGSVVVFEVFGPILVKVSVLKSGEVSIMNAVPHKSKVIEGNQLMAIVKNFLGHLGLHEKAGQKSLAQLVLQERHALRADAGFDMVTKFIESYPYDAFPVLDHDGKYLGYISFDEIKDASYDPVMKDLVRAADLLTTGQPIDLDHDDIDSAYDRLRGLTLTSLPVIRHDDEENPLLVGIILQRDLAKAHVKSAGLNDAANANGDDLRNTSSINEPY